MGVSLGGKLLDLATSTGDIAFEALILEDIEMSISWFITPYDPQHWQEPNDTSEKPTSDLRINPSAFYDYLANKLPGAVFHAAGEILPTYEVTKSDRTTLRIHLYHKNQIVSLSNNPTQSFFDFVLLYRAFVPTSYPLFFFNSSSWESLELKPETTQQDIRRFMGFED